MRLLTGQDPTPPPQDLIRFIQIKGNKRMTVAEVKSRLHSKEGRPFSENLLKEDKDRLLKDNTFLDMSYDIKRLEPGWVDILITIQEFDRVDSVEIAGVKTQNKDDLEKGLTIKRGDVVHPFRLQADHKSLRDHYLKEGYAFAQVSHEIVSRETGILLKWNVREGPRVTVASIEFTGNLSASEGKLRAEMMTEENSFFSGKPYVEENLQKDIDRIKFYYWKEGWLDMNKAGANSVFVKSVRFNEDRTRASIVIQIVESKRYRLRKVSVTGHRIFSDEEIYARLKSKPGAFITEHSMRGDVESLRDLYGERAYLNIHIDEEKIFTVDTAEVDLTYKITENEKVYVGMVVIQGNPKTRDDVIRREVRVYPGEEYNRRELKRGIERLAGTQWFSPAREGGIRYELQDTDDPSVKDLLLEVKELETGRIQFAGGYSSGFGLVGLVEYTQRNFDVADPPKSLGDFFSGNAFAGGGQSLRIRLSPGARRSSYGADFREPYLFGEEVGLRLKGFKTFTVREAYDEDTIDTGIGLEKRWGDFKIGTSYEYMNVEINNLEAEAPERIRSLEGKNNVISLIPTAQYDTRDSPFFTTSGVNLQVSYKYAGGFLPGDFDFGKATARGAFYMPVYKTDNDRLHVISVEALVGIAHEFGDTRDVPFFEKFYAGGRGTIRGFKFRGVGPRESGVPLGDDALVFGSAEYTFPLYSDLLRGAMFLDTANLAPTLGQMHGDDFRLSTGVGIRFMVPFLSSIPIALDFGYPLDMKDEDRRQTITFDIGWF